MELKTKNIISNNVNINKIIENKTDDIENRRNNNSHSIYPKRINNKNISHLNNISNEIIFFKNDIKTDKGNNIISILDTNSKRKECSYQK